VDWRTIIDLNGHSQSFSNVPAFSQGFGSWIGNDSTNTDATVIFDSGNVTNHCGVWICDNLNASLTNSHRTSLKVLSGGLHLLPNPVELRSFTNINISPSGPTNNAYTGDTLVSGGILQVDTALGATAVAVSGSGILAGSGPFSSAGSVTINSGGTLSPGGTNIISSGTLASAIGIMTNNGTLTLNPGSTTYVEVKITTNATSTTITNDTVRGLSSMVYNGGTLLVANVGTNPITSSSVFQIFYAATYTAGPMTVLPAVPAPGQVWDTSQLASNGSLHLMSVNTNPPPLTTGRSGNSLTLSWPQDHAGWRLQAQTNSTGLGTNWVTVPGTTNALSFTVPIASTNPAVFFRLIYP
jgi:hypothetical protein